MVKVKRPIVQTLLNKEWQFVDTNIKCLCFRYILVLYAERGLVKNGNFHNLFNVLYIVFATTLAIWAAGLFFVHDVTTTQIDIINVCFGLDTELSLEGLKYLGVVVRNLLAISMIFMGIRIVNYVKRKSKNGKVPVKFGRYQRNILTLRQCYLVGLFIMFLALRIPIAYSINKSNDVRSFMLISNLVFVDLLDGVVFPTLILINLRKAMPEFYSPNSHPRKKTFYVTQPDILPRRNYGNDRSPPPTQHHSLIYVVNERNEEASPPIRLQNNLVSTTYINDKGETIYMKYLAPVD